jgi:hypothetical protein
LDDLTLHSVTYTTKRYGWMMAPPHSGLPAAMAISGTVLVLEQIFLLEAAIGIHDVGAVETRSNV